MRKSKQLLATAVILVTLGTGVARVSTTFAADEVDGHFDGMSNLVTAIAERFNLNQDEVQAVFDEQRDQMEADRQAAREASQAERLAAAVTSGKLTQSQSDAILAKQNEMKDFMASLEGKTQDEKREAMKTQMDALKTWADENDIPEQFIRLGGPGGMRGRGGHGPGFGPNSPAPLPPTDSTVQE